MDSEDVTLDRVACLEVKMQGKDKRGIGREDTVVDCIKVYSKHV